MSTQPTPNPVNTSTPTTQVVQEKLKPVTTYTNYGTFVPRHGDLNNKLCKCKK